MFDVLVYLFENYAQPGIFPETAMLVRKLLAVGFEESDISAALEWLSGLENPDSQAVRASGTIASATSQRLYCRLESIRLPVDCRNFLYFLENTRAIDALLRETIIERTLALRDVSISLSKLKIIVLMVLWRCHEPVDLLLLEELLSAEGDLSAPIH